MQDHVPLGVTAALPLCSPRSAGRTVPPHEPLHEQTEDGLPGSPEAPPGPPLPETAGAERW